MTDERDTNDQDDDATYGDPKQQCDRDEWLRRTTEDEENPAGRLHYGVGQLQAPLRCDSAHDTRYGQK